MNEFEDIEQLLKPQCEFKASDTLKQEVLEKAREEVRPHRIVRMWPWLAAACVVGFIIMFLMPPKTAVDNPAEGNQLVAKAESRNAETPKAVEAQQSEPTPEPTNVSVETPKRPKLHKKRSSPARLLPTGRKNRPFCVNQEEPVQMSEETRMELLLANLKKDVPKMEDIDTAEEIRQMRMRGERLTSMCNF